MREKSTKSTYFRRKFDFTDKTQTKNVDLFYFFIKKWPKCTILEINFTDFLKFKLLGAAGVISLFFVKQRLHELGAKLVRNFQGAKVLFGVKKKLAIQSLRK